LLWQISWKINNWRKRFAEKIRGFDPAGAMVNLRSSQGKLHMKQVADWCGARMAAGRGGNQHGLKGGKAAINRWFWHWRWRSRKAFTCSVQR